LRPAIGLIAAYALALSTILTGFTASAAVPDRQTGLDPAAIICLTSADGTAHADTAGGDPDGTAPAKHAAHHCALCAGTPMGAAPCFMAPLVFGQSQQAPLLAGHAHTADIKTLPGQPRAPPRMV
jgi:hypothetical protein